MGLFNKVKEVFFTYFYKQCEAFVNVHSEWILQLPMTFYMASALITFYSVRLSQEYVPKLELIST